MPLRPRIRPFPLKLSIGTDICYIPHVTTLLKKHKGIFTVRLMKKILNPSERKWFRDRMLIGYAIADRLGGVENPHWRNVSRAPSEPSNLVLDSTGKPALSELPVRNLDEDEVEMQDRREKFARDWRNMSEDTLDGNLKGLATWLAGRWAAKEAVIKAHTWRRLTMHDINIYKSQLRNGITMAPMVTVLAMNESWGDLGQGERAHEQAEGLGNVSILSEEDSHWNQVEAELQGYINGPLEQEVKISISHDGDYATAVCLAAKEHWKPKQPRKLTGQPWRQ